MSNSYLSDDVLDNLIEVANEGYGDDAQKKAQFLLQVCREVQLLLARRLEKDDPQAAHLFAKELMLDASRLVATFVEQSFPAPPFEKVESSDLN